jgi:hypothetical protein
VGAHGGDGRGDGGARLRRARWGGGGAGATSRADRQRTQGTGSVLGDAAKQSESIAQRSLEIIRNNASDDIPLFSDMAMSLRSIDAQMVGVASLIARTMASRWARHVRMNLGSVEPISTRNASHRAFRAAPCTPFAQSRSRSSAPTTRSLADSGIQINQQTVGDARQGFSGSSYADITTNRRALFGLIQSSSTSRDLTGLPADVAPVHADRRLRS